MNVIKLIKAPLMGVIFAFSISYTSHAQITIGTNEEANSGSLLDLKENDDPGVNSFRGLGLPRVNLTKKDYLYPMFEDPNSPGNPTNDYNTTTLKDAEDSKHIGLTVYHLDKCTFGGRGVYTWTGTEWVKLGQNNLPLVNSDIDKLYFASGLDILQPLSPQSLTLTWSGGVPTITTAPSGGLTQVPFTSNPILPPVVSPAKTNLLPDAMTAADIALNRWRSKETLLTYSINEPGCPSTKDIIINQTNYALSANGSFTTSYINHSTLSVSIPVIGAVGSYPVLSNAKWNTSVSDPFLTLAATTPAIATESGAEKTDNTAFSTTFSYNLKKEEAYKYRTAEITYSDANASPRFNDVTVTIHNCSAYEPTMEGWAKRAGFTDAEIAAVTRNTPSAINPTTLIQLHRDHEGNLFLSGMFGVQRWTITNIGTQTFDPVRHPSQPIAGGNPSLSTALSSTQQYYYYPWKDWTIFNPAPGTYNVARMGFEYNFEAATNHKAWGTQAFPPSDIYNTKQGICPTGWRLPSYVDWTYMIDEVTAHASLYSSSPDNPPVQTVPFKDICEPGGPHRGTSNPISTDKRPGFNAMTGFNTTGRWLIYWSGSGTPNTSDPGAYAANFGDLNSTVVVVEDRNRDGYHLVRCVKD